MTRLEKLQTELLFLIAGATLLTAAQHTPVSGQEELAGRIADLRNNMTEIEEGREDKND